MCACSTYVLLSFLLTCFFLHAKGHSPALNEAMRACLERVHAHTKLMSPAIFETYACYLLATGSHQRALETLGLALAQHPAAISLHLLHARVLIQSGVDVALIADAFARASTHVTKAPPGAATDTAVELLYALHVEWLLQQPNTKSTEVLAIWKVRIIIVVYFLFSVGNTLHSTIITHLDE